MVHLEGHSAVFFSESIWIFGGRDASTAQLTNAVLRLRINDLRVSRTSPAHNSGGVVDHSSLPSVIASQVECQGVPPSPRAYHSATVAGNVMYVMGGTTVAVDGCPEEVSSEQNGVCVYALNLQTLQWRHMTYFRQTEGTVSNSQYSYSASGGEKPPLLPPNGRYHGFLSVLPLSSTNGIDPQYHQPASDHLIFFGGESHQEEEETRKMES